MSALRRALIALGAAAFALGAMSVWLVMTSHHSSPRGVYLASGLTIGWSFSGTGLLMWWRRPQNRVGFLMTAFGLTWLLGSLSASNDGRLVFLGWFITALPYPFLVLMLLSFPDGRLHTRLERAVMVGTWLDVTVLQWPPLFLLRFDQVSGCTTCPANPLLVSDDKGLATAFTSAQAGLTVLLVAGVIVALVKRWRGFAPSQRPALSPVLWTGGLALTTLAASFAALLSGAEETTQNVVFRASLLPLAAVPYAFLAGLVRSRFSRAAAVSELVASLSEGSGRRRGLRDALADTFGDPSLILGYWLPERGYYVDGDGRPVELPDGRADRAWTPVDRDGEPLAVIIHDATLEDERQLLHTAGAAAGLALENERLDAELRARVEELQRSRERLIEAGLAERRKLERNLHDGAQQRLVALRLSLRLARDRVQRDPESARELLDEAMGELDSATVELRELARGIHPAVLSDRGLPAALKALAGRVPVPVELVETPAQRLPALVEIASYYVVAEALTNIAKYSHAASAQIRVSEVNGSLTVEVSDDGVGGADPNRGSGLRGLADRIATLDGRLEVHSPAGQGTTITARIPCA